MSILTGIVRIEGDRTEGVVVRAHQRNTGDLLGESTTDVNGVYAIDVGPFGANCYVVALPPDDMLAHAVPSYNATILDQFTDIEDENFLMTEDDDAVITEGGEFILLDAI